MSFWRTFKAKRRKKSRFIDVDEVFSHIQDLENKIYKPCDKITEDDRFLILKIYTEFYPSLHEIPSQRQATHHTFMSIFTFMYSVAGYLLFKNYREWLDLSYFERLTCIALVDAVFFCLTFIWSRMLKTYVNFNYCLITITESMEKFLPVQPLTLLSELTKRMNIPTNLAKDMALLPKLLVLLTIVTSLMILFI